MIAPIRSEVRVQDVVRSLFCNRGYSGKLESELQDYFGAKRVLLTHSGRSGLYFLLKALPQKKVYLPAYNCWAVTEAVSRAGKEIEYVDISLQDYNMDVSRLRDVLVEDSIIVATHQFGIPCDIEGILLARKRNCFVIEDNAASFGAEIDGQKTGTFGAAAILSFDYSKTVVSGKGGAILFRDEELYRRVAGLYRKEVKPPGYLKSVRWMMLALGYAYATHPAVYPVTYAAFRRIRGASRSLPQCDISPENPSYLYDYDEMRAKLAYLGMKRLQGNLEKRAQITRFYFSAIACKPGMFVPVIPDGSQAALVKFPFRLNGKDRDAFYRRCVRKGVDLSFPFQFHYGTAGNPCPNAREAAEQTMALPVYSSLTRDDLARVKDVLEHDGE